MAACADGASALQAVRDLQLEIAAGEFIVLLGPSGAGKTTTLRLVAGLEKPDVGGVRIGGIDVTALAPALRDVTFVFQQYSLYPHLSVFDNLAFPLRSPLRRTPEAEVDARVGGAFHVHIDPLAQPGMKGADDMRFLALQKPTMLSFDWNEPPQLPQARAQRTFVVVRFEPLGEKLTRVSLHHTGWGDGGEWDQAYAYFERAWPAVLGNMKKRFDTGPVDWSEWMAQLKKMHEGDKPK